MDPSIICRLLPAVVIIWLQAGPICAQPASQPDSHFWVPSGIVHALAETNGVLYLGGEFTQVGPVTGGLVPLSPMNGSTLEPFTQIDGAFNVATPDGAGGWFIGGVFTLPGTLPRTNLLHLLGDHSVDPDWVAIPNSRVWSIELVNGRMFVGGEFTEVNGQERLSFAELNPRTGELLPLALAPDTSVQCMASTGGLLYLGGSFTKVGGLNRTNFAAIDLSSDTVSPVRMDCAPLPGHPSVVSSLKVAGDRIYVGGTFSGIGASNRLHLAAVQVGTGRVLPWDPNPNGPITPHGIEVFSNQVFVAGGFNQIGRGTRAVVAAVDSESGDLLDWRSQLEEGVVYAMALSGRTLCLGGDFHFPRHYFAAVDAVTGQIAPWDPAPGNAVMMLAAGNGEVYAGGLFDSIGGVVRTNLAAIDVATGRALPWDAGLAGYGVFALALHDGALFAAGLFDSVGGQPRAGLCAVHAEDATLLPFDARLGTTAELPPFLRRLAASGTNLFVGGDFDLAGLAPANGFVVVDSETGETVDWNAEPPERVYQFAVGDDWLYLAATFADSEGQLSDGLAAFDLAQRRWTDWRPTVDGNVSRIELRGGQVYLSGGFSSINGESQPYLGSVDARTGQLNAWKPAVTDRVRSMTTVGSIFYGVDGSSIPITVGIIPGDVPSWSPTLDDLTECILFSSRKLFIGGGGFSFLDGAYQRALTVFTITNLPPSVSLVSPTNLTQLRLPVHVTLQPNTVDTEDGMERVDFYANGALIASSSVPPYAAQWSPLVGTYRISAVALDRAGNRGISLDSQVTVRPPVGDVPPVVSITSPHLGAVVQEGEVAVSADAIDVDSHVERVEFFIQTNLIAVASNAPYSVLLTNLPGGHYSLTAVATDEYGVAASSSPVEFEVNSRPLVAWVSSPPFPVYSGTNLPMTVRAVDRDGSIRLVTMDPGSGLVPIQSGGIYFTFTYSNIQAGTHYFVATATDDRGGVGISAPLVVSVLPRPTNDLFAQRIVLPRSLGVVSGSNVDASSEPSEPSHAETLPPRRSVWWSWTPDFSGPAFVSVNGSSFRTILAVHTGNSLTGLIRSAFAVFPTNRLSLLVTNGTQYQIAVDGASNQRGDIVLTVGPEVALRNLPLSPEGWTLRYAGPTNVNYVLQSSTNRTSWLSTMTNRAGTEQKFLKPSISPGVELNRLLLLPNTP